MKIEFLSAQDLPAPGAAANLRTANLPRPFACTLIADLRDPRVLPLLRPAPVASDFRDEARPGASNRAYFLARRAALRSLVGLVADCRAEDVRIGYDGPGAPRVQFPDGVHVSVSGRGALAALAVASAPVGIDIEPVQAGGEIIEDVLHADERAQLASLDGDAKMRHFLRIWTAKEAYLKALGTGLTIDPAHVAISFDGDVVTGISHAGENRFETGASLEARIEGVGIIAGCVVLHPA